VQLNEVLRTPLIEYLAVFAMAGLNALSLWVAGRFRKPQSRPVKVKA
jgi:hypothetical protein